MNHNEFQKKLREQIDSEYPAIMNECKEALCKIEQRKRETKVEKKKEVWKLYIKDGSYKNAQVFGSMEELMSKVRNLKGEYLIIKNVGNGDEIVAHEVEEER